MFFLKDQVTGVDLFTQIIPGSYRLISQKDLCKAKEQSTHNPGSPCYQGLYGIHGVCHNFTERTMDAYGASMGDKFSGIENVSGNQSGRLSYMVYGRFGLPVSPAQNWSTCKAFVETKCTLEATFKSGPGVAANSIGAVGTAASAVATSARSPASVSGISRLPSYKMLQLQEY